MHVDVDKYAYLKSPVHNWDTRCKIISLLLIIFSISVMRSIFGALTGLTISISIALLSRLPARFLFRKVWYPVLFLIPLFLFLPFSSGGDAIYDLIIFNIYYEGLILSLLILIKTVSIILLFSIIMTTSPFIITTSAFRSLGVPVKLLNMILFTYRYIFVFLDDIRKMRIAMVLKGFKNTNRFRTFQSSANVIGSLLIRSYEQTERIFNAMILRGYSEEIPVSHEFSLKGIDILKLVFMVFIVIMMVFIEINFR